jgi:hypothetical protein
MVVYLVIPVLGRLRQKDHHVQGQHGLYRETLPQKNPQKTKNNREGVKDTEASLKRLLTGQI